MEKKEIYYWSPSLVNIATNQAVIRSAGGISKYGKSYKSCIINFFGEFQKYEKEIQENKINLINFFNKKIYNYLPRHGYLKSRLSFLIIFILSFFPLLKLLRKEKPHYLIIHLITSLPLTLLLFFKFETKFILRISGLPKLGMLRKFLWRISLKKIHAITCPTEATKKYLMSLDLLDSNKIFVLPDPIISVEKISKLKKEKIEKFQHKEFIFSAGRLTRQKNFSLLIEAFNLVKLDNPNLLLIIAGEGEEEEFLKKKVKSLNLENKIIFIGYSQNVYKYMSKSTCFLLSSLWEDPGFVLIEAAYCRSTIISSNCENGPEEILDKGNSGYLFESNNLNSLTKTLNKFLIDKQNNSKEIIKKKVNCMVYIKRYTKFRHFLSLKKILENNL